MGNPGEFLQTCAAGKVWLFCSQCDTAVNFNAVEHLDCIENPHYWGPEPWWHDTRVFRCPLCLGKQQSVLHVND